MTERQKQASITRQKIIDSARDLISQKGYDHISVDDIVANCGIAKGTFYHHFKTKDDLMACLSDSFYDNLRKNQKCFSKHPFPERIHRLITNWYQEVDTLNLYISRETFKLYVDGKHIDQQGVRRSHMKDGIALFQEILSDAVGTGELCPDAPIMILSQAFMFALQGSALYHCEQADAFDVMDWSEKFILNVANPILKPYLVGTGACES